MKNFIVELTGDQTLLRLQGSSLNMLDISYYLHRFFAVGQSDFRLCGLCQRNRSLDCKVTNFFGTSAIGDKVNERHGQKSDTSILKMVIITISVL